jgi:hypothetical protein
MKPIDTGDKKPVDLGMVCKSQPRDGLI